MLGKEQIESPTRNGPLKVRETISNKGGEKEEIREKGKKIYLSKILASPSKKDPRLDPNSSGRELAGKKTTHETGLGSRHIKEPVTIDS